MLNIGKQTDLAHPDVDAGQYIQENFQAILGKLYQPYHRDDYFALALDKREEFKNENDMLLSQLESSFFVQKVAIGSNPESKLSEAILKGSGKLVGNGGVLMVMMENYSSKSQKFIPTGIIAVGIKWTKDTVEIIENIKDIGYILFHHRSNTNQHLFKIKGRCTIESKDEIDENIYKTINTAEMYIKVPFESNLELESIQIDSTKKTYNKNNRYDAQYITWEELKYDLSQSS
ncbi:MAG: hypothetical protein ACRC77_04445 [Bacteroidales bacterium]